MNRPVAAAILAGGRGTRLGGVDKAALVVGGQTILQRQLQVLRPLFTRILLVLASDSAPLAGAALSAEVTCIHDRPPPGRGPLAGIEATLATLADDEAVVCVGGDMPLLQPSALLLLRDVAPDAPAVVPLLAGHPEPLFARYDRRCLPVATSALAAGQLRTGAFARAIPGVHLIEEAALRTVDPDLRSLTNVNTPEDVRRIEALLAGPTG